MAEMKTTVNDASVEEFLSKVEDEQKRRDSFELLKIMKRVTKKKPKMWGPAIIGFGSYHYKYESGREGDMPQIAFSPRKQNLTLYIGVGDALTTRCSRNLANIRRERFACISRNWQMWTGTFCRN